MKTLAQYLAEYLAEGIDKLHRRGLPMDFSESSLCPVIKKGIDTYEATEGVTVKVEKGKEADMAPADKDGVRTLGLLNECIQAKATLEDIQRKTEVRIDTLKQTIDKAHRCHIDSSDQRVAPADRSPLGVCSAREHCSFKSCKGQTPSKLLIWSPCSHKRIEVDVVLVDGSAVKKRERIYAMAITLILEIEKSRWEKRCGYDQEVNDVATDALLAGEAIGDNTSDNS